MRGSNDAPAAAGFADHLKAWPQYLLPQHALSHLVFLATRSRLRMWKDLLIRRFIRHYDVDMSMALEPEPSRYASFNDFFTRALKPQARSWVTAAGAIACPVDGFVSQTGHIDGEAMIQAKGRDFTLTELFGGDAALAERFGDGDFATLYLSPRDYHRIHMPVGGTLRTMIHVPGALFAVNPATTRVVPRLFARNERVICVFETAAGPMALIMVGAIFVGSMETVWAGAITPGRRRRIARTDYGPAATLAYARGSEIGRFNMGSTVILLFAKERARWSKDLRTGAPVRLGMELGTSTGAGAGGA